MEKQIKFATKLKDNVFECDRIRSPFVFGVISPKIYLPCSMQEKEAEYVILHEKNHIRRLDHVTRLISFALRKVPPVSVKQGIPLLRKTPA